MELFVDVLVDSIIDTLELLPFLFVTYLVMELIEHSTSGHVEKLVARSGHAGPVVGGILGALPQCGFSAMAATLYAGGVVTVGTLVAVLLSTSDEMIPVFIAHQQPLDRMFAILAVKVVAGVCVGLLLDAVLRALHRVEGLHPHIHDLCERAHCHCDEDEAIEGDTDETGEAIKTDEGETGGAAAVSHHHAHHHGHGRLAVVRAAAVHTLQVSAFILLVTFLFGLLIEVVGQDTIGALLSSHPIRATFLAALVGLIPNCGASVTIAELYLDGVLATGPMIAGLLSAGGVGLLVLYRTNTDLRNNVLVTLFVYAVSVLIGLIVSASGILF